MKRGPYNVVVGARVRERRLALGKTLKEVADALELNESNILRYETGESGIGVETLVALGHCLNWPAKKFLEGIEEEGA